MSNYAKYVRYSGSDDWSALYIDGKLDRVGDHYLIDERISQLLGVEDISSDDFLRGGNQREDVAESLLDIEQFDSARKQELVDEEIALVEKDIALKQERLAALKNEPLSR